MYYLIILCALLFMLAAPWFAYCNTRTFEERKRLIDVIYSTERPALYHERNLEQVSYYDHLWTRVFFRNPWELYDSHIRTLVGEM